MSHVARLTASLSGVQGAYFRWIILATAGAVGLTLGFLGWLQVLQPGSPYDVADAGYRTFLLLGYGGAPPSPMPWTLGTARLLLPVVAGWTAVAALAVLYRERFALIRQPFRSGHVVVVGLGDKGMAFVRSSRRAGHRVAAIERDPNAATIAAARGLGAVVVIGDGQEPEILASAGARRARAVFAVTGDDGANITVVQRTSQETGSAGTTPARCIGHVGSARLGELLRLETMRRATAASPGPEFFSVEDYSAQGIVARFARGADGVWRAPLILVGITTLAMRVQTELARNRDREGAGTLTVLTVPANADGHAAVPYDEPPDGCVETIALNGLRSLWKGLPSRPNGPGPLVVIDPGDDSTAVSIALALRPLVARSGATMVVIIRRAVGLGAALDHSTDPAHAGIHVFSPIDTCCSFELADLGQLEALAQMIHEEYVAKRRQEGSRADDPALAPWSHLASTLRESNRDQARDIVTKLSLVGCTIVPAALLPNQRFRFSDEEVEQLAVHEHHRWCAERTRAGWRLGPKDHAAMTTPYLVDWDDLGEDMRELDRQAVRDIPRLLFRIGAAISRDPIDRHAVAG